MISLCSVSVPANNGALTFETALARTIIQPQPPSGTVAPAADELRRSCGILLTSAFRISSHWIQNTRTMHIPVGDAAADVVMNGRYSKFEHFCLWLVITNTMDDLVGCDLMCLIRSIVTVVQFVLNLHFFKLTKTARDRF